MAIRNIVKEGDPSLEKECRPVTDFNGRLHTMLDDMKDTLIDAQGVGLAAPQIGVLRRAAIVIVNPDVFDDEEDRLLEFVELINPEIISAEGEQSGPEGCLSVPGKRGIVTRPMKVKVKAQNRYGEWLEHEGEGLTARAFCHEIDHLHGRLYLDLVEEFVDLEGDE